MISSNSVVSTRCLSADGGWSNSHRPAALVGPVRPGPTEVVASLYNVTGLSLPPGVSPHEGGLDKTMAIHERCRRRDGPCRPALLALDITADPGGAERNDGQLGSA